MSFLDLNEFFNSNKDWQDSFKNDPLTGTKWEKINLGCTFIPEFYNNGGDEEQMYLALTFILNVLEIKHIRLGIRWNQVWKNSFENGNVNLKYYKKLIQFLIKKDVEITLCVGPVKSPGWPEQYIPECFLNECKTMDIDKRTEFIERKSAIYFKKLIETLKLELPREMKKIKKFQVDNEPFNKFGDLHFDFSTSHLVKNIQILKENFGSNIEILINTPGRFDLKKFKELKLLDEEQDLKTKYVLGWDYYYAFDKTYKYPFAHLFNSNTIGRFGDLKIDNIHHFREKYSFKLEVTEAQMEPWGKAKAPGNSVQSLKYVLLQTSRFLKLNQEWPLLIRLWGIEQFVDKYIKGENTSEHDKMVELIRSLNN